jgi:uncharacterized protein (DUF2062 family)
MGGADDDSPASRPGISVSLWLRQRLRTAYVVLFPEGQGALPVTASVFLGVFIGVLPTIGFALPLTVLATSMCRVPKGPGLVASFIATPPTLFLVFFPGAYFLGQHLLHPPDAGIALLDELHHVTLFTVSDVVSRLWLQAKPHLLAFGLGIFIVSLLTALLVSALTYWVVRRRLLARPLPSRARP